MSYRLAYRSNARRMTSDRVSSRSSALIMAARHSSSLTRMLRRGVPSGIYVRLLRNEVVKGQFFRPAICAFRWVGVCQPHLEIVNNVSGVSVGIVVKGQRLTAPHVVNDCYGATITAGPVMDECLRLDGPVNVFGNFDGLCLVRALNDWCLHDASLFGAPVWACTYRISPVPTPCQPTHRKKVAA